MTRHICYITGTRADFGLMRRTLDQINQHPDLRLSVIVTGMHLSERFGGTEREVDAAGYRVIARLPVAMDVGSGLEMATGISKMTLGIAQALEAERPDVVLLLGDRGEMLAAAIAAIHLNIPIAHIHGGERSGTVDEPVRHAISKLAHLHLPATEESRKRLIGLGEAPSNIIVVGAPGLSDLHERETQSKEELAHAVGFESSDALALLVFHPVVQEQSQGGATLLSIGRQLRDRGIQIIALMPNADAGGEEIRTGLQLLENCERARVFTHMRRPCFLNWMAEADLMIGNSSAGIIEAASFGTPVVNVGSRQLLRQRNRNTFDVTNSESDIGSGIDMAISHGRFTPSNVYGDGSTAERIAEILSAVEISSDLLRKCNAY